MVPDKKKIAGIIVSRMNSEGKESQAPMKDEHEIDSSKEGLKAAAEELMMAIKDGSSHGVMSALSSFHDQYEPESLEDEENPG